MRPGDIVKIIETKRLDWENKDWLKMAYEEAELSYPNGECIIEEIMIAEDGICVKIFGSALYLHPDHFEVIIKENKMKTKMKLKDLLTLQQGLWESSDLKGDKFAYAILKNRKVVDKKVEEAKVILAPTKEYLKFDDARVKLAKKFADKGANGEPLVANQNFVITKKVEFDKALKELMKSHDKVVKERDKQLKAYNNSLEKTIEIELYMISPEEISPEITANVLSWISAVLA